MDNIDNFSSNSDNTDNDGTYVIRAEDIKPLNDSTCTHSRMKLDPSGDEIGDTRAWICPDCKRGIFLPKRIESIT